MCSNDREPKVENANVEGNRGLLAGVGAGYRLPPPTPVFPLVVSHPLRHLLRTGPIVDLVMRIESRSSLTYRI